MEQRSSLSLVDVVINLLQRGLVDKAIDMVMEAIVVSIRNGLDTADTMRLPSEEFIKLYKLPELKRPFVPPFVSSIHGDFRPWDNVIYGEAAWRE